jgi:hypothetical protein
VKRIPILLALLLTPSAVLAQIKEFANNEFRYSGGALVCLTDDKEAALRGSPCLRIGNLFPGTTIKLLEARIVAHGGKFNRDLPQEDGSVVRVYALPGSKSEKGFPYLAVSYEKGVAKVLQLTGHHTAANLAFSSIRLGDPEARVKELIGPPSSTKEVAEIGGTYWSYRPFPISIEMVAGKVYSIRIVGEALPTGTAQEVDPDLPKVTDYLMKEEYPEVFAGKKYRVRIQDTACLKGFWDKANLFVVAVDPHFRQSPTLVLFKVEQGGKVTRLTEGLAPGPLVRVSGDYLDSHVEKEGVDMAVSGDPMQVVKISLGQKMNVVRYAKFFHMDGRQGRGGYLDLSDRVEFRNLDNCENFEFSKVETAGAGTLGTGKYVAALVGEKVHFYRIDGVTSEGFLKKSLKVVPKPSDFEGFAQEDGALRYKDKTGQVKVWPAGI